MRSTQSYLLIILYCLVLYLPGFFSLPVIDRDEPHFAQATKQMIESHDYWQIKFQDEARHLKPPGIYWVQTLFVKQLSHAPFNQIWVYRLPSLFGAIFAVMLTFMFTRRRYGPTAADWAASLLAASFLLIVEAHLAITDALLLATVTLMQGALWQIYVDAKKQKRVASHYVWLFWLGMAAGFVIKGLTPLYALLTLVMIFILDKDRRWFKELKWLPGLALMLLLTLLWLVPICLQSHSFFLWDMIRGDVLPKVTGGQQSHGMPPGYYCLIFTLMFWPASVFFWQAAHWAWTHRHSAHCRFLIAWFVSIWIFYEIVPTKLPQYLLPIYPALAIMVACTLLERDPKPMSRWMMIINRLYYFVWALFSVGFAVFLLIASRAVNGEIDLTAVLFIIFIISIVIAVLYYNQRQFYIKSAGILLLAAAISSFTIFEIYIPKLSKLWVSQQVAEVIDRQTQFSISDSNPLLSIGFGEPSLIFYLGTHHVKTIGFEMLAENLRRGATQWILIDSHEADKLTQKAQQEGWTLSSANDEIQGFNYANGHAVTLYLYQIQS